MNLNRSEMKNNRQGHKTCNLVNINFLSRTLMKTSAHRSIDWNRLMLRNKVVIAVETEIQNSPADYEVSDEEYKDRRELYTRALTRTLHSPIFEVTEAGRGGI